MKYNGSGYSLILTCVILFSAGCSTPIRIPPEYKKKAEEAPVIVDGVVIKFYGGSQTILVDFLVEHIHKNKTKYQIPKIITVSCFSSESEDMRLFGAQHATLYLEPAVPSGNRYRWNRVWQYPAFPKTDEKWEGLFQAGRWEYSTSGPWPAPAKPIEYK